MRKKIIIALIVLLALTIGYIGVGKYGEWRDEKELGLLEEGAQYGYEQAVIQLVQKVSTCEQVPLRIGDQSLNVIAVDCLSQAG